MEWVAFDVETTGLPRTSWPVEIGARRYHDDGTTSEFQTLVNPGVPIPQAVVRIHGITDHLVAGAPTVRRALERFFSFAEGAVLVAHNAAFDAGIVAYGAARCGVGTPGLAVHDSVRIARRILPHLWSYRLSALRRILHLDTGAEHRALPDAQAVGLLMERLLKLGPRELSAFPRGSPGHLGRLPDFGPGPAPRDQPSAGPLPQVAAGLPPS